MRSRPNLHGIEEIRRLPKTCSDCGKPIFGGLVMYEIESNYLSCENCYENSDGPEDGYYVVIEEYNPDTEFKFFRDEQSMEQYEKKF